MARHMGRWPPIVWPLVTFANLLILTGSSGRWEPGFLVAGILPLLAVCALSRYLAARDWSDRARPPIVRWAMLGLLGFYLLVFAAAGLAGPEYAVAGLLAGLILLTALCLLITLARSKTQRREPPPRRVSAPRRRSVCGDPHGRQGPASGHARASGCTAPRSMVAAADIGRCHPPSRRAKLKNVLPLTAGLFASGRGRPAHSPRSPGTTPPAGHVRGDWEPAPSGNRSAGRRRLRHPR
jgi:hypothetical protein